MPRVTRIPPTPGQHGAPVARLRFRRTLLTLALAAGLIVATAAPGQTPAAPTAATPEALVDPALMAQGSRIFYEREVNRLRAEWLLDTSGNIAKRVRGVGNRLVVHAATVAPVAIGRSWAIQVETRTEPMLWSLPNGGMLITSGLIEQLSLTNAELAAMLAHAIAHELAGHDARDASRAYRRERDGVDPDANRAAVALAGILARQIVSPHYDDADERAADGLALELLARSGIDPGAAVSAWRKVAQSGKANELLALHPAPPERIANLEAQLPGVMPLYQAALAAAARPRAPLTSNPQKSRPPPKPPGKRQDKPA